jgi:hypothetical protein
MGSTDAWNAPTRISTFLVPAALTSVVLACGRDAPPAPAFLIHPPPPPPEWEAVIGEYAADADSLSVLEALAAPPPEEEDDFLPSDLVDLLELDPTLALHIRYATTDNFMGEG